MNIIKPNQIMNYKNVLRNTLRREQKGAKESWKKDPFFRVYLITN